MKRDPNTRIIQRPTQEDLVYRQRVGRNLAWIPSTHHRFSRFL